MTIILSHVVSTTLLHFVSHFGHVSSDDSIEILHFEPFEEEPPVST